MKLRIALIFAGFLGLIATSNAAESLVAVAANFTEPAKEIAAIFNQKTGNTVKLSFGATGAFYKQIANGAPFDIFLAADYQHPQQAVSEGYAVTGTSFTYATGSLVLWSAQKDFVKGETTLNDPAIMAIAYCDPDAAPYGRAAIETLTNMGLADKLKPHLVEGQNIAQAYQFVKTGNAQIGFVALSQVINDHQGSRWVVPQRYYNPIRQDAVLLKHGNDNTAAKAFLSFLRGSEAQAIIEKYGYHISN